MERITIHCDYGCPYAQRLESILTHLRVTYDVVHTHDGPIPRIRAGDVALYETSVIADYLAEVLDWADAYPNGSAERATHRLAIRQIEKAWGSCVTEIIEGSLSAPGQDRLERDLDDVARLVSQTPAVPSMLSFALAPFWIRWQWLEASEMIARVANRPELLAWLRQAEALTVVAATTPDKQRTLEEAKRHAAA